MPIVHDWLARRAALDPEHVALIDANHGERRICYREWDGAASRTAAFLHHALGVRRGDRVAVLAHNRVEYLDLLFACAKLGAILQLTANAANTVVSWGLSSGDVALLNAPLFHAGGLNVFTTPLVYAGGASVVCRGFDVAGVFDLVHRGVVSLVFGVPTMFIEMQRHPRFDSVDFSRLKLLISGGAPCPLPVFERFFARGVDFKTGYGLTEAGPNNFWLPPGEVRRKPGCVGVPLFHVEARIEGEQKPGDVGELLLRGPHLCAGYWRRPEETAKTFAGGWLHTGDLATRDADGCFTIAGRSKDLILSGGENIYPSEVESVLAGHPDVAEVAVIGVADARWGETPRALVVLRPGTSPSPEALIAFCEGRLARYKTPRSVRFLDALPRTSPGKVDRRALAASHGVP